MTLRPCPFCGSHNVDLLDFSNLPYEDSSRYWVQCECSAGGANCDNAEEAKRLWNNRAFANVD
jgi:hypothetical protein